MHKRLVSYLRDNRDHIVENWLTEAEVPATRNHPEANCGDGLVPYTFFTHAFEQIVQRLEFGPDINEADAQPQMNEFLGLTCSCKQRCFGGRVCMELHDSGLTAFMSVFAEDWDTDHEFNQLDRECNEDLINHALSGFFGKEIETCAHRTFRTDCPFAAQS